MSQRENPREPTNESSQREPDYGELRRIAARYLANEDPSHTLQPTALVHEAWLKLRGGEEEDFNSRTHFLATASRAMRQILVDHARRKRSGKRDGGARLEFDESLELRGCHSVTTLDLDALIERLEEMDDRVARVVELRVFGGLTIEQTADVMQVSHMTISRDWRTARAWMAKELGLSEEP